MEVTLQWYLINVKEFEKEGRNPYFIGSNSAIDDPVKDYVVWGNVAILILLEVTLQSIFPPLFIFKLIRRNPYFIGSNSAIRRKGI